MDASGQRVPQGTLENVAREFSVTRERVRQIEAAAVYTLGKGPWAKALTERLIRLLMPRVTPLYLPDLVAADGWLAGLDQHPALLAYFLPKLTGGEVRLLRIEGQEVITTLPAKAWPGVLERANAVLGSGDLVGQPETACREAVVDVLPIRSRELADLLWDAVSKRTHFEPDASGEAVLRSVG